MDKAQFNTTVKAVATNAVSKAMVNLAEAIASEINTAISSEELDAIKPKGKKKGK